jgi:hypothetical protein
MDMSHIKIVTFRKKGSAYELEIDTEDPENMVLETVTLIEGPRPEHDIDPTAFEDDLDDDDWVVINEKLEALKP